MPSRSKYPKWFSPHSIPYFPTKPKLPEKTVEVFTRVAAWNVDDDQPIPIKEIVNTDCDRVTISYTEGPPYELVASKASRVPNPNYVRQMEYYQKDLAIWKDEIINARAQREKWDELKEKWDKETQSETESRDLKTLAELKKKYPNH